MELPHRGKSEIDLPTTKPADRIQPSYCIYRLVGVLRSLYNFELRNYVADCRRRAKLKKSEFPPTYLPYPTTQLMPIQQLLYLLWSQSTKISNMYIANDPLLIQRQDSSSPPGYQAGGEHEPDAW